MWVSLLGVHYSTDFAKRNRRHWHGIATPIVQARLAELGKHVLEPITVEPFTTRVDGTEFGWKVDRHADGTYFINIEPGDFICYYAPWDGYDYDT